VGRPTQKRTPKYYDLATGKTTADLVAALRHSVSLVPGGVEAVANELARLEHERDTASITPRPIKMNWEEFGVGYKARANIFDFEVWPTDIPQNAWIAMVRMSYRDAAATPYRYGPFPNAAVAQINCEKRLALLRMALEEKLDDR
jgi:hypothetical protein